VRETWARIDDREFGGNIYYEYKADTNDTYPGDWPEEEAKGNPDAPKWCPSIHMPREAARLFLLVKNVWVERLQEITEEDAICEGLRVGIGGLPYFSCKDAFMGLWDGIYAKRGCGWETNSWVWVVEFEKLASPPPPQCP